MWAAIPKGCWRLARKMADPFAGHRIAVRRQRRSSIMMRAVPGGFEVFIPLWMRPNDRRVRAFIEQGLAKLGGAARPAPPVLTPREEIIALAREWAARMGVQPGRITFREMTRKWGSCSSTTNITLNTRLMWLPARLVEYVVVHELAHLKVFDHGAAFRALMSQHLPDWQAREAEISAIRF